MAVLLLLSCISSHTGSHEDGLGSDGEDAKSDDLEIYMGLGMDEVRVKDFAEGVG